MENKQLGSNLLWNSNRRHCCKPMENKQLGSNLLWTSNRRHCSRPGRAPTRRMATSTVEGGGAAPPRRRRHISLRRPTSPLAPWRPQLGRPLLRALPPGDHLPPRVGFQLSEGAAAAATGDGGRGGRRDCLQRRRWTTGRQPPAAVTDDERWAGDSERVEDSDLGEESRVWGERMDLTIGPGGKGLSASDARHELASRHSSG